MAVALQLSGGKNPAPAGAGSVMHASLGIYNSTPAPGGAKLGAKYKTLDFQFNPKELTIQKSAKWTREAVRGSKQSGPPQYIGPEPCKLTVEMMFDATAGRKIDVVDAVETLLACCTPTPDTAGTKKPMAPLVTFNWGGLTSFAAYISQVSAKFTLFAGDGTPIRAVCSVTLDEMPGQMPKQNPTSGSLATQKVHRTVSGDSLALIAYREYGNPAFWRPLAAYNHIDDPMSIPPGTSISLPSPDELVTWRSS